MNEATPILEAADVKKNYGRGGSSFAALKGVSFSVEVGESVGFIGLSGCGKSTLLRILAGLEVPSSGEVRFHGASINYSSKPALREYHKRVQMVFQSPISTFSPYMTIETYLMEGVRCFYGDGAVKDGEAERLLAQVGLDASFLPRLPHQLSGGQLQRVVIARALSLQPEIILLDEPTSALDILTQRAILELLAKLGREYGMSFVFVGHDSAVVRLLTRRVFIMRQGLFIEELQSETMKRDAKEEYTRQFFP
ncbi:MAG: ABC transporter ATP-binding protein [Schwartzia sp.]|nr:ABC transporter ATP-binding protein [Schwartzia sp. (in: firmicutes)]